MVRGADRHITLPPGWVEKFVEAPEGCDYKAQAFGHEKEIHYYISRFSEEMYWVRMHERGHAWDWELRRDMPHCPNKCVLSKRGVYTHATVYAASVGRGGRWFCDDCAKRFGLYGYPKPEGI